MCARASAFSQVELRAAGDDLEPVRDEALDQLLQVHHARAAVVDRQHDGAERGLELGVLVEVVEDDLRASAPRLSSITTRMPSLSDSSRMSEMPSIFLSCTRSAMFSISVGLVHRVGDLGDDDAFLALLALLDRRRGRAPCSWPRPVSYMLADRRQCRRSCRRSGSPAP